MGTRDRREPDGWRHNAGVTPCSARASMTTRRHTYCRLRILTLCRGDFLVMPNDDVPVLGHGFGSHTGPQYWSKIAFTLVIPLSSSRVDAPSMRPLPVTRPLNVGIHHELVAGNLTMQSSAKCSRQCFHDHLGGPVGRAVGRVMST